MHARWLVEIATLFAVQSSAPAIVSGELHASAAHRYWAVARNRFERWQARLSLHRNRLETAGASRRVALWRELRPTLEEIFLSDVLTRLVAAFGAKLEADGVDGDLGPIVYSVYTSQEDVRHRTLRLLMVPGLPVDQAVELNRIRHTLEHWTDSFIAQLPAKDCVMPFAFKPERVQEMIDETAERHSDQARFVAWQLMTASCQKWMAKHCTSTSANPMLNRQLGEACLAMLHPDRFPSLSPFPAHSGERIATLIDQADLWLAKILYSEIA